MQNEKAFPTGIGGELNKKRETLKAVEVKNRVRWVNPIFEGNLPLNLVEGQESKDIGLFLTSQVEDGERSLDLEVESHHNRSALLVRAVFTEKKTGKVEPQLFRDVDIKGLGNILRGSMLHPPTLGDIHIDDEGALKRNMGILSFQDADRDAKNCETFHGYGVRTDRVVAIIELEEVIYEGKKISIAEAKSLRLIPESVTPVLEVRAFIGTHARFIDASSSRKSSESTNRLIKDAMVLVAQEIGIDIKKFGRFEYAKWLAETIGRNLSLMHNHGWSHRYLREGHNITLDGCFLDFDSAEKVADASSDKFRDDYEQAQYALYRLLTRGLGYVTGDPIIDTIFDEYKKSYEQNRTRQ